VFSSWKLYLVPVLMTRLEASRLALLYLTEQDKAGFAVLNYPATLASLTEYATCWYVDFCYQQPAGLRPPLGTEAPGFIIDKKAKHICVISWPQLFELNCERFPY
jgi:hypothetical protein